VFVQVRRPMWNLLLTAKKRPHLRLRRPTTVCTGYFFRPATCRTRSIVAVCTGEYVRTVADTPAVKYTVDPARHCRADIDADDDHHRSFCWRGTTASVGTSGRTSGRGEGRIEKESSSTGLLAGTPISRLFLEVHRRRSRHPDPGYRAVPPADGRQGQTR
jgi:hypothetical protein